ncbi:uncharacterized protein BDZ99DRAFT_128340 [Mytilinidion resinicola]|uniref:Uncharacterized protein n=1 Tax=Mytilinidion resinicola TaxID=574789 RepID=A0A6A6Z5I1_9PEZI|nr:uncharacterized protein BDZ99DRAFT_128340 [Mytilinidion resinicola]KAF2816088.1 hypothetical protein BDZ99DRAFT_128340 [Mytilinidion resinicola]
MGPPQPLPDRHHRARRTCQEALPGLPRHVHLRDPPHRRPQVRLCHRGRARLPRHRDRCPRGCYRDRHDDYVYDGAEVVHGLARRCAAVLRQCCRGEGQYRQQCVGGGGAEGDAGGWRQGRVRRGGCCGGGRGGCDASLRGCDASLRGYDASLRVLQWWDPL